MNLKEKNKMKPINCVKCGRFTKQIFKHHLNVIGKIDGKFTQKEKGYTYFIYISKCKCGESMLTAPNEITVTFS